MNEKNNEFYEDSNSKKGQSTFANDIQKENQRSPKLLFHFLFHEKVSDDDLSMLIFKIQSA